MVNAFTAELMKLRRSPALYLAILLPLVVVIMGTGNYVHYLDIWRGEAWEKLYIQVIIWYAFILLPLSIALLTMLVCHAEHKGNAWKLLFSLPVSRNSLYLAKLLVSLLLVALSLATLMGAYCLAGLFIGIKGSVPWALVLHRGIPAFLCTWPIVAIQLWLAARFKGISWPIGLGIVATITAMFSANSHYGHYFIWTYPMYELTGSQNAAGPFLPTTALIFSVLIIALSLWEFTRREMY